MDFLNRSALMKEVIIALNSFFYRKCKSKPFSGLRAEDECRVYFAKTIRMLVTCLMQRAGFFSS